MEIHRIENSVFSSSTWVLVDARHGTWVVDCGDVAPLLPLIAAPLRGVLLTHAHFDHIYGLNALAAAHPGVTVWTNAAGGEALLDEYENLSAYHDAVFRLGSKARIRVVDDGATIELWPGSVARVHATPGHSPSCLTYVAGNHIFTGDAYIPGIKVVTMLPGGDKILAAQSTAAIAALSRGLTIHPGHGPATQG